jgi:hypothetical protein
VSADDLLVANEIGQRVPEGAKRSGSRWSFSADSDIGFACLEREGRRTVVWGVNHTQRPRSLRKHMIEVAFHGLVALARSGFQCRSIRNSQTPARGRNNAGLQKVRHNQRYSWTTHRQHRRKEFMRQGKVVTDQAIVGVQQPTAASGISRVDSAARDGLRNESHDVPLR